MNEEPVDVTPKQARAIAALDVLLNGRGVVPQPMSAEDVFSDDVLRLGGARIAASLLQRLLREGGSFNAVVLRSGKRCRGALWSRELRGGFSPVITDASLRLWRKASTGLIAQQRWLSLIHI